MHFTLKMKSDNEAFTDDAAHEVARILREVADKLEQGREYGTCRDYNGNKVGEWSL